MQEKSPSILSAIKKIRSLLTREEKFKFLGIASFALCTSLLEVLTASVIVVFAQVLNKPEFGQEYLYKIGFGKNLSQGRIVFFAACIVGIVYVVKNLVAAAEVFFQNFSIQKMNYKFKNKLLQHYAEVDYELYLTRNSSLGITILGAADKMFSVGIVCVSSILTEVVIFTCLVGLVVLMNPSLALLIFLLLTAIVLFVTKIMLPQFYLWGQKMQEAGLHSTQNLTQFFHGFKEIVLLGKRDFFINAYQYYFHKQSRILAIQTATNALPRLVIELLFIGIFVTTIAIFCLNHEKPEQIIGAIGGYLYAAFRIMPGINRTINHLSTFKSVIPAIECVYQGHHTVTAKESYVHIPEFCFEKSIKLHNVNFRYLNTEKDALNNVSFEIYKGECIGIVGETGSGKSTLVDVLLGLLRPYYGSVLIDNQYLANSYQWHQKIGYVPQSIYLTDDTIESNIAFGEKEIDADRINAAIAAAQLRKFIDQLPDGAKTFVGERGVRLSGGERQRVSIARALYHNPEVLIFDEATSALDNETEVKLMETIHSVSQNRTVIMIAHRLTTLKDCDRIFMMEKGRISKITNYENLQKN